MVRKQTRVRIDKLVASGRNPVHPAIGYSSVQLNSYELLFKIIKQRSGELPGLSSEECRDEDIKDTYAELTRNPNGHSLAKALKQQGFHVFRLWDHTARFELVYRYRSQSPLSLQSSLLIRKNEQATTKLITNESDNVSHQQPSCEAKPEPRPAPLNLTMCRRYQPGNDGECACESCFNNYGTKAEWIREQCAAGRNRDEVMGEVRRAEKDLSRRERLRSERHTPQPVSDHEKQKYIKNWANRNYMRWRNGRHMSKRCSYLADAVMAYKELVLVELKLRDANAYWRRLLSDESISSEGITPETAHNISGLESLLTRVRIFKQSASDLRWRSRSIGVQPLTEAIKEAIELHVRSFESALVHWRSEVRIKLDSFKHPVTLEI